MTWKKRKIMHWRHGQHQLLSPETAWQHWYDSPLYAQYNDVSQTVREQHRTSQWTRELIRNRVFIVLKQKKKTWILIQSCLYNYREKKKRNDDTARGPDKRLSIFLSWLMASLVTQMSNK